MTIFSEKQKLKKKEEAKKLLTKIWRSNIGQGDANLDLILIMNWQLNMLKQKHAVLVATNAHKVWRPQNENAAMLQNNMAC